MMESSQPIVVNRAICVIPVVQAKRFPFGGLRRLFVCVEEKKKRANGRAFDVQTS